jgi:hypothetical protein
MPESFSSFRDERNVTRTRDTICRAPKFERAQISRKLVVCLAYSARKSNTLYPFFSPIVQFEKEILCIETGLGISTRRRENAQGEKHDVLPLRGGGENKVLSPLSFGVIGESRGSGTSSARAGRLALVEGWRIGTTSMRGKKMKKKNE